MAEHRPLMIGVVLLGSGLLLAISLFFNDDYVRFFTENVGSGFLCENTSTRITAPVA